MSYTLLLDLDDTLLVNDFETFLPTYLLTFAQEIADFVDPDSFIPALLASTRKMLHNRRPDCTLREVFEAAFIPAIGRNAAEFQIYADRFYEQVFPSLRDLTSPRPGAVELIKQAVERGYRLVIATNPIFPRTAILQRLAWANLPVEEYPFELVTSYETFHFGKPDPAYYAEVMARIGWPKGVVVTIGDDIERDINASRQLGLAAFWLQRDGIDNTPETPKHSAQGELVDVLPWLDSVPAEELEPDYTSSSAMVATLRATAAALDSMCRDLQPQFWTLRPQAEEWCMTEILCHMRDVDHYVNLPRVDAVLNETNPFIPGRDTDLWVEECQYIRQDGAQALHQFFSNRLKLLDILEAVDPESWQLPARHAIFGPTHLAEIVGIMAGHDRLHIQQAHQVLQSIS